MARILILEADESLAATLTDSIQRAGLTTSVAVTGRDQTLRQIQHDLPALIILDLALDGGHGLELCHAIREVPGGDLVPILLIGTGEEGVKNFGDALAEGGDYYFSKPVDMAKVVSKIRTYVGVEHEATTMVGVPSRILAEDSQKRGQGAALGDRVEQLMGLGTAFQGGLLVPPADQEGEKTRLARLEKQLFDDADTEPVALQEPSSAHLERQPTLVVPLRPSQPTDQLPTPAAAEPLLPPEGQHDTVPIRQAAAEFPASMERIDGGKPFLQAPEPASDAAKLSRTAPLAQDDEALSAIDGELDAILKPDRTEDSWTWGEVEKELQQEAAKKKAATSEKPVPATPGKPPEAWPESTLEAEEKALEEFEQQAKQETGKKPQLEAEEKAVQEEEEERAREDSEEKALREFEEKLLREAGEKDRREAEEKAIEEASEKARLETEEKARQEAEEKAQKEAEEKARREAEEKAQKEAEEKAHREAEEKARIEAAEKALREAEEKARKEAEEKAHREAEEKARKEAAERARREAEEKARREAEEKARKEAAEKAQRGAEEKARKEAEEKARREAEEKARKEAAEKARRGAEEKARKEAEEKARREAEEKARKEAAEKARREAEEKAQKEAEEKARIEADERTKAEEEKKTREEAEHRALLAAEAVLKGPEPEVAEEQEETEGDEDQFTSEDTARLHKVPPRSSDEEEIRADSIWADALEEDRVEGEEAEELAQLASSWVEERLEKDQVDSTRPAPSAAQREKDAKPGATETLLVGDRLVKLLEQEASLAREQAAAAPGPGDEDGVVTVPDLPPRPGEEPPNRPTTRRYGPKSRPALIVGKDEGFLGEDTDELEPGKNLPADTRGPDSIPREDIRKQEAPRWQRQAGRKVKSRPPLSALDTKDAYAEPAVPIAPMAFSQAPTEGGAELSAEDLFRPKPPPEFFPPEPAEADLARELVPALLWQGHIQRSTGVMVFAAGGDSKEVFFEEGVPVAIRSTQTVDRLEEMLLRQGLIDRAAHTEARIKGIDQPRALAAHLVERGALKPEELFPLVRRHLEEGLLSLFEWQEGTMRFVAGQVPDAEKVKLSRPMAALIMEGIRRKFLLPRMVQILGGPSSLLAPMAPERRPMQVPDAAALGFTPAEREIFRLINGLRPIEEIVFLSGQDATTVYRVLVCGVVAGLLVLAVSGLRGGEGDEEAQSRSLEIGRRRIDAKFEQANKSSYFEILGVSEIATPYEIEEAYRRLKREFHPMHFVHPAFQGLAGKIELIRQTLDEAHEVLSDDLLREGYRQSLTS